MLYRILSPSQPLTSSSEEAHAYRRLIRNVMLVAGISTPTLSLLYYVLDPNYVDYHWVRALMTLVIFGGVAATYVPRFSLRALSSMFFLMAVLFQAWLLGVGALKGYHGDVFFFSLGACMGGGILLGYLFNHVAAPVIYFAITALIGFAGYSITPDPELPLFSFASNMFLYGIIVAATVHTALKTKQRLVDQRAVLLSQEQALHDSQRIGQIGSWTYDPERETVEFSAEAKRIFNFMPDEEISFRQFLTRLDRKAYHMLRRAVILVLHRERPYTFQHQLRLPSGQRRWVEYTGQTVWVNGRKELRGTVRDIDVLKAHEDKLEAYQHHLEDLVAQRTKALREQQARYELITAASSDLISIHDAEGRYQFVSPAALPLTGYTPEELRGRIPIEFMAPDEAERTTQMFLTADKTKPITYTSSFCRKDGETVWMEVTARAVLDEAEVLQEYVAIARDVTSRHREKEHMKAQHQQDQATLRRNIVTTLPHELRTPLSAIIGLTSLLQHDWRTLPPEDMDELIGDVNDAGHRMETLIEKYTLFAYLIMATPESVEAPSPLQSKHDALLRVQLAAQQQARQCQREADLHLELTPKATVHIALPYLHRVVHELTNNAFKFSQPGTPVTVSSHLQDGHYVLQVTDAGRGFPDAAIPKIGAFMQFERDQYEQQGAGLGLAIVKQLLRLYEGVWHFDSSATGTTVTVSLPLAWAHAEPAPALDQRHAS